MRYHLRRLCAITLTLGLALAGNARPAEAAEKGETRVLLLGDSTTIGSVCRQTNPEGPHLEQILEALLAAEADLPPVRVVNQGRDGETIHGLLTEGRYDREISGLEAPDFVFIRYGLNDLGRREDFEKNYPLDYADLIARLRRDFPQAEITPTTIIPYFSPENDEKINSAIRRATEAGGLTLFDLYTRYQAELEYGANMLNYRRYPLEKIPERRRTLAQPFVRGEAVVCMDNQLDAHFRDLPGWFSDRHPNLAGYHVIADETAKFLAPKIRARAADSSR